MATNQPQPAMIQTGVGEGPLASLIDEPGIIVDTHLKRVTGRIGLTDRTDPDKIEAALDEIIPRKNRTAFSHLITFHGRAVCVARRPKCPDCVILKMCDYGRGPHLRSCPLA
jgi:endonuclease-3